MNAKLKEQRTSKRLAREVNSGVSEEIRKAFRDGGMVSLSCCGCSVMLADEVSARYQFTYVHDQ